MSIRDSFDASRSGSIWIERPIDVWVTPVRERGAYRVIFGADEDSLNEFLLPRAGGWPLAVMDDFGDLVGVQP